MRGLACNVDVRTCMYVCLCMCLHMRVCVSASVCLSIRE
uniref:Uncharacterized protein n=1 Tax=Wuchereria bancrofti TaxID=6293 RepID=A0AAF5Q254_WUCBA